MSAPVAGMEAGDQPAAAELLEAFKTIDPAERQKHEAVLDYWLSIRGERELPPLRDLDPLEISDAAPLSVLVELIGGGEDAEFGISASNCGPAVTSTAFRKRRGRPCCRASRASSRSWRFRAISSRSRMNSRPTAKRPAAG